MARKRRGLGLVSQVHHNVEVHDLHLAASLTKAAKNHLRRGNCEMALRTSNDAHRAFGAAVAHRQSRDVGGRRHTHAYARIKSNLWDLVIDMRNECICNKKAGR